MTTGLHEQLLAAHDAGDMPALIRLYMRAADTATDQNAASFFLTHAFVFALEAGASEVDALRARLVAQGREEMPPDPSA